MDPTEQLRIRDLILDLTGSLEHGPDDDGSWLACLNSYLTYQSRNPFPRPELRGLEAKGYVLKWVEEESHFLPSYSKVVLFPKDIWTRGHQSLVLTGCTLQDYKQTRVSSFWSQDAWGGCLILEGRIYDVERNGVSGD